MSNPQNFQMETYKNIPLKNLKNQGANIQNRNQKFTKGKMAVTSPPG